MAFETEWQFTPTSSDAVVSEDEKKAQQLRCEERLACMHSAYMSAIDGMHELHQLLPDDFCMEKTGKDMDDLSGSIHVVNASFKMFIAKWQKDPGYKLDKRDVKQLKANISAIYSVLEDLQELLPKNERPLRYESILPPEEKPRIKRLPVDPSIDELMAAGTAFDNPYDPLLDTDTLEKTRNYLPPGVYKDSVKDVITALLNFEEYAAPLVGYKAVVCRPSTKPRPDHRVAEHRDWSMEYLKPDADPASFGVPNDWIQKINNKLIIIMPALESGNSSLRR